MHFSESLKKNRDFRTVYRDGKSYANRLLVMYTLKNDSDRNRLGISVSKKVGNSVVRHHITRLVRESYRLHEDSAFAERNHPASAPLGVHQHSIRLVVRIAIGEVFHSRVLKRDF